MGGEKTVGRKGQKNNVILQKRIVLLSLLVYYTSDKRPYVKYQWVHMPTTYNGTYWLVKDWLVKDGRLRLEGPRHKDAAKTTVFLMSQYHDSKYKLLQLREMVVRSMGLGMKNKVKCEILRGIKL